jgi:hypothetical protein
MESVSEILVKHIFMELWFLEKRGSGNQNFGCEICKTYWKEIPLEINLNFFKQLI